MVRAILEGRKTQTRRIVKLDQPNLWEPAAQDAEDMSVWHFRQRSHNPTVLKVRCRYGTPGDRLWVREACYIAPPNFAPPDGFPRPIDNEGRPRVVGYSASMDGDSVRCATEYGVSKTPSIHMPRWASRLTLEVVGVRVERLQEISEEDAKAEGVDSVAEFAALWDSIHDDHKWYTQPLVWVVEFKKDGGS